MSGNSPLRGFVLTEYAPGIEELFDIGSEIDTFNSSSEMIEKINYYLKNPSLRKQMSKKANLRALNQYSDVSVWNKIGKYISMQEKNRKNHIYIDEIFNKSYSAYQFSRMLSLLFKFKINILINDFSLLFTLKIPYIKLFLYYSRVDFINNLRFYMQKFNNLNQKLNKCLEKIIWLVPSSKNSVLSSYSDLLNSNGILVEEYCFNDRVLELGFKKFIVEIKDICSNYDLVIATLWADSQVISPQLLSELRLNSYVIIFSFDDEIYSTSMSINYSSSIDLVVTADYFGRGIFDQIGVPTIYFPFSRLDLELPSLPNHKKFDISFIGNLYTADRQNYLGSLEKAGFEVNIYGKGSKNGFLSEKEYISIIRSSRINLNFTKVLLSSNIKFNEPWRTGMRQFKEDHLKSHY